MDHIELLKESIIKILIRESSNSMESKSSELSNYLILLSNSQLNGLKQLILSPFSLEDIITRYEKRWKEKFDKQPLETRFQDFLLTDLDKSCQEDADRILKQFKSLMQDSDADNKNLINSMNSKFIKQQLIKKIFLTAIIKAQAYKE
ncbi:MAG: hypothetical protein CL609_23270 [Anaerolineaceae bacterium]|nr:hypothetical protein [Anaerolineaceae bacterium]